MNQLMTELQRQLLADTRELEDKWVRETAYLVQSRLYRDCRNADPLSLSVLETIRRAISENMNNLPPI